MPDPTPTAAYRRRRRRDVVIATVIAVVAVVVGSTIYLNSDSRAVQDTTATGGIAVTDPATLPSALRELWTQPSSAKFGATASAYGVVVTTTDHDVVGRDPRTGSVRWTYSRPNRELCAVYSPDTSDQPPFDSAKTNGIQGVIAVYRNGNYCAEVISLDPRTGARVYQRTTAGALDGHLVYGDVRAGWMGTNLIELWGYKMIRTIQYGDQPAPQEPGGQHPGCTFLDIDITSNNFATLEQCEETSTVRLAINRADPSSIDKDKNETVFRHSPLGDIDTHSPTARIVGITNDRVAILVSSPLPAVVVYESDGTEVSRTPVSIPAAALDPASGPTPRITIDDVQYSLLGDRLVAVTSTDQTVKVTSTPTTTAPQTDLLSTAASSGPTVTEESRSTPQIAWVATGVLGLPTGYLGQAMVATGKGIEIVDRISGKVSSLLPVSRPETPTRVDLRAIGTSLVELRTSATGASVAVLEAS